MRLQNLFMIAACSVGFLSLEAGYTLKGGKLLSTKEASWMSVQEHYTALMESYQKEHWYELIQHSLIIIRNFPESPFAEDAFFYVGLGYFELGDYELANRQFTDYLKKQAAPKHFEEAINHKFAIAERFEFGAKKHLMGFKTMPKWASAKEEALKIYEEVITALPNHDVAARALFAKGRLLLKNEEFKESIETFQILIRRFPKNPYAPKSYLMISEAYFEQIKEEYPDLDLLDLAEINLKNFKENFPSDEQLVEGEVFFKKMQEIYAKQLYDIGKFYQKTKKPKAAYLYYNKVLVKFPETKIAQRAQKQLSTLPPSVQKELGQNKQLKEPEISP